MGCYAVQQVSGQMVEKAISGILLLPLPCRGPLEQAQLLGGISRALAPNAKLVGTVAAVAGGKRRRKAHLRASKATDSPPSDQRNVSNAPAGRRIPSPG